jgi:hypothetical protein
MPYRYGILINIRFDEKEEGAVACIALLLRLFRIVVYVTQNLTAISSVVTRFAPATLKVGHFSL